LLHRTDRICERAAKRPPEFHQQTCGQRCVEARRSVEDRVGEHQDRTKINRRKLEYDLYYIKNLALSLDAYIVFHTIKTMLPARGAQ
jgi:lipopolysaccharide/colanic/teichoic acid biosynthesis glycosyltransferase